MIYLRNVLTQEIQAFDTSSAYAICHQTWEKLTKNQVDIYLFNQAKENKIIEIKKARDNYFKKPIEFNGNLFKAGGEALLKYKIHINDPQTEFPIKWRLADDINWMYLDQQDTEELSKQFTNQEVSGYKKESEYLALLESAITFEDINNIIVDF